MYFPLSDGDVLVELTPIQELLGHLNPINVEDWSDMKVYEKGYEIFKVQCAVCNL